MSTDLALGISFFRECENARNTSFLHNVCQGFNAELFYALLTRSEVHLVSCEFVCRLLNPSLPKQPFILIHNVLGLQLRIDCLGFLRQARLAFLIDLLRPGENSHTNFLADLRNFLVKRARVAPLVDNLPYARLILRRECMQP